MIFATKKEDLWEHLHKKTKKAKILIMTKNFGFLTLLRFSLLCFLLKTAIPLRNQKRQINVFLRGNCFCDLPFLLDGKYDNIGKTIQALIVEIFIVVSSNTSNKTFTVSSAVNTVTLFSQAQALIAIPSASCVPAVIDLVLIT